MSETANFSSGYHSSEPYQIGPERGFTGRTPIISLPESERVTSPPQRARAFVFNDSSSVAMLERLNAIAPSDATILIVGETGTGKELIARECHGRSRRRDKPFVSVNCAALNEQLLESELFGHERGAFTGALTSRAGWFETANRGTLFLDEIGDLPLASQVKLLRVLQEREVVRVGARQPTPIDVRVIVATNVNLAQAVAAGRFREDLYYRLNVVKVDVLPLRERPGDVIPLVEHFIKQFSRRLSLSDVTIDNAAKNRLLSYPWPGNIRELENCIHNALLVGNGRVLLPENLQLPECKLAQDLSNVVDFGPLREALLQIYNQSPGCAYEKIQAAVMETAFEYCDRNQVQTALLLGISRNIVRARLMEIGLLTPKKSRREELTPHGETTVAPCPQI